jgi:hypothetical protein
MKRRDSWFKSEAKLTTLIVYGLPGVGLLAALVVYLIRLLRTGG